jgi:hypothetical protein
MPSLREEQKHLQRAILGWRTDARGRGVAPERIAIYRYAYRARLEGALRTNYPKLALLLGDAGFRRLARRYAVARPSHHFSIRWHGEELAEHMAQGPLADLARMEWALGQAFDAPDASPMRAGQLERLPAADWACLPLALHPSVRVVALRWAVEAAWRALRDNRTVEAASIAPHDHALVAWRKDLDAHWRSATWPEARALLRLQAAGSLEGACDADDEAGAQALGAWFAGWLSEGMLIARPPRP